MYYYFCISKKYFTLNKECLLKFFDEVKINLRKVIENFYLCNVFLTKLGYNL
jgi:hypothetical protein